MGYRRLFIMRKDLNMSAGKMAAQIAHCAEAYWTRSLKRQLAIYKDTDNYVGEVLIPKEEFEQYINGSFVKTVCEAKNKKHLLKAAEKAQEMGMIEDLDYGLIRDNCLTELQPEEEDGRTLTGIWFKPLPDEIAHEISKKYQLYK